jgi:hypothetical protein
MLIDLQKLYSYPHKELYKLYLAIGLEFFLFQIYLPNILAHLFATHKIEQELTPI